MNITINTETKTVKIEEPVNLGTLVNDLQIMLPAVWKDYTIINVEPNKASMFGAVKINSTSTASGTVNTTNPIYFNNNPIPFTYGKNAEVTNTIADGNR